MFEIIQNALYNMHSMHTLYPQCGWGNFSLFRQHRCLRDDSRRPLRIRWTQSWWRYTFMWRLSDWLSFQFFYPGWSQSFWWSSHLARHCIRSLEGCDSVLYCSQLLEDKALLASNKDESSTMFVPWLPARLTMEDRSRCEFIQLLSQVFAIGQIMQHLKIMAYGHFHNKYFGGG